MTGSLQIKNGVFYAVLSFKDENNKWRYKWVCTNLKVKDNKRRAEAILSDLLTEYLETTCVEPDSIMLCEYIKEWVAMSKQRVQVTTYDVYSHMLNRHLYPYFKKLGITLNEVTPYIIQKYYSSKLAEGLSTNSVVKHHAIIRSTLQQALRMKLVSENVCDLVDKPKRTKYRGDFYNSEEINALLAVAKGTPIETPIYLAAYFGLRRSEIIGLRWDAVDFSSGTLTVKHKVVRAMKDGKLVNHATNDLKTDSSYRVLPLDERLMSYLREIKNRQDANRKRNGNCHIHEYDPYICVDELGGLINPDYVSYKFGKILKQNNLKPIRFHDLRHSCASLLLALGYSMKDIQEWLGHSNYQTTANLYSHVDPRNKKAMIQGLSSTLVLTH
jgi:integrase